MIRESIDQSDIKGCWCAHDVNLRQYIQADLGEVKTITGIATQGYIAHDNWVASYRLGYSENENALEWYRESDDERVSFFLHSYTSVVGISIAAMAKATVLIIVPSHYSNFFFNLSKFIFKASLFFSFF